MSAIMAGAFTTTHGRTIEWRMLDDGGFVAGDISTGNASYAYPTSTHATAAKRKPHQIAIAMVTNANAQRAHGVAQSLIDDANRRFWLLIRNVKT